HTGNMYKELIKLGKEEINVKVVLSERGKKQTFYAIFFSVLKPYICALFCELKLFKKEKCKNRVISGTRMHDMKSIKNQ
ncbi:hypothetical protein ACQP3F_29965, partial [Escherichia coli]